MSDGGIIYDNELIDFIKSSVEFTELVEKSRTNTTEEFIDKSLRILTNLYLKMLFLPEITESPAENVTKFVSEERWIYIHDMIAGVLQDKDELVDVQDLSVDRSIDYLKVSLSELFADIYQDIGDVLYAYRLMDENIIKAALYDCKQNFEAYWGVRLLTILGNLHRIKYFSNDSEL